MIIALITETHIVDEIGLRGASRFQGRLKFDFEKKNLFTDLSKENYDYDFTIMFL